LPAVYTTVAIVTTTRRKSPIHEIHQNREFWRRPRILSSTVIVVIFHVCCTFMSQSTNFWCKNS